VFVFLQDCAIAVLFQKIDIMQLKPLHEDRIVHRKKQQSQIRH